MFELTSEADVVAHLPSKNVDVSLERGRPSRRHSLERRKTLRQADRGTLRPRRQGTMRPPRGGVQSGDVALEVRSVVKSYYLILFTTPQT